MLLLDEATSALDAESEGVVQAAIGKMISPPYLPCISPISPLYLPYISPISPLYLPCISQELQMAMQAAKDSRDAALLGKPIRHAKKAVEFDAALLKGAEELKAELDEERKEKERLYLAYISPISPQCLP